MKYPGELYTPSARVYRPPDDPEYPLHDHTIRVFAGQLVGIREVEDKLWLVSFLDFDLGYFDEEDCRVEPLDNPFNVNVLPM